MSTCLRYTVHIKNPSYEFIFTLLHKNVFVEHMLTNKAKKAVKWYFASPFKELLKVLLFFTPHVMIMKLLAFRPKYVSLTNGTLWYLKCIEYSTYKGGPSILVTCPHSPYVWCDTSSTYFKRVTCTFFQFIKESKVTKEIHITCCTDRVHINIYVFIWAWTKKRFNGSHSSRDVWCDLVLGP